MKIDASKINFQVDPLSEHKIQMQMQKNPNFAQVIHMNITDKIYGYIQYKIRMRENLNLAIKGEELQGMSCLALSLNP